jgi:acyl carrier protein
MEKAKFFTELKDTLELDGIVNENTILHLTSLATLSVIVFIDENFSKQIKAVELKNVYSVGTLMELIGMENFK